MKYSFFNFTIYFLSFFVLLFACVSHVYAVEIGDAFKIDDGRGVDDYEYQSVGAFITGMIPNVMIVANLILFFLILLGGFMMIANSGDPQKKAQASAILTSSLIGFLIVFGAYWLMQILGTVLGFDILMSGAS